MSKLVPGMTYNKINYTNTSNTNNTTTSNTSDIKEKEANRNTKQFKTAKQEPIKNRLIINAPKISYKKKKDISMFALENNDLNFNLYKRYAKSTKNISTLIFDNFNYRMIINSMPKSRDSNDKIILTKSPREKVNKVLNNKDFGISVYENTDVKQECSSNVLIHGNHSKLVPGNTSLNPNNTNNIQVISNTPNVNNFPQEINIELAPNFNTNTQLMNIDNIVITPSINTTNINSTKKISIRNSPKNNKIEKNDSNSDNNSISDDNSNFLCSKNNSDEDEEHNRDKMKKYSTNNYVNDNDNDDSQSDGNKSDDDTPSSFLRCLKIRKSQIEEKGLYVEEKKN